MFMFTFSVFDWEYAFSANLVQKIKTVSSKWNSIFKLIQIRRIQWWCSLFWFSAGNAMLGTVWSKKSKFQLKVKLDTYTNSNMQNSIVVFTFLVFDQKCPFLPNLVLKGKIISLSWNLVPTIIRIPVQISVVMFTFFCFRSEMHFFGKIWSKMSNLSVYC